MACGYVPGPAPTEAVLLALLLTDQGGGTISCCAQGLLIGGVAAAGGLYYAKENGYLDGMLGSSGGSQKEVSRILLALATLLEESCAVLAWVPRHELPKLQGAVHCL